MNISIYTDGSCGGNGKLINKGSYGFVVIDESTDEKIFEKVVLEENTSNNKMEMKAMLSCLEKLEELNYDDCTIYTDSELVRKGLEEWYAGWEKRNFKNVKNLEIWKPLKEAYDNAKNIKLKWVRGHNNNKWNEYIDKLIVKARK